MESSKLFDGEYRFVELVWAHEPVNSTELAKLSLEKLGWKKSTVYTVLRKLCAKGILRNEDAVVTSLLTREQVQRQESETLVRKSFGGSLPMFVASFLNGRKISTKEAEELKRIIEEASE